MLVDNARLGQGLPGILDDLIELSTLIVSLGKT